VRAAACVSDRPQEEGALAGNDDAERSRWQWSFSAQRDEEAVAFNDQM
jgi:hypothetical protein